MLRVVKAKPTINTATDPRIDRLHGLDVLRAGAALAVVLLHAVIPYMAHPLPHLRWSVTETDRSGALDVVGWGVNALVMPLFFLLSGFLTSQASRRREGRGLLLARSKRLGAAFVVGCLLILPLDLYAWLLGLVIQGEIPIAKLRSLKIEGELRRQLGGVSHLWYLQCLAALTLLAIVAKRVSPLPLRRVPLFGTLLFAAALSTSALGLQPEILLGFRNLWFPSGLKILFYAGFFLVGWRWSHVDWDRLTPVRRAGAPTALLLGAALLFACLLPEIRQHVAAPLDGLPLWRLAAGYVLVGGAAALGIFTLCATGVRSVPPAAVRYVARASLWIYLLHHPVVALTQVDLLQTPLSPEAKTLIAFAAGVAAPLLTYHVLVERTWLGRLLEGTPAGIPQASALRETAQRRAA